MPAQEWEDSFGTHLARLRRAAGLTQEQLADRAGLSVRAISSLECGSRHPRRLTLDRLAEALHLTGTQRTGLHGAARYERRRAVPLGTLLPIAGPAGPLIGRRTELAELHGHLTGDGPAALTYDGESGIGKSRLLAEAVAIGTRVGMPVLVGVGRRDSDPYSPVADALADHVRRTPPSVLAAQLRGCAGLELLLPELTDRARTGPAGGATSNAGTGATSNGGTSNAGTGDDGDPDGAGAVGRTTGAAGGVSGAGGTGTGGGKDRGPAGPGQQGRRLMFEAVGRFLDNIAGTGRLLLVLDDLHWAGADTAELLAYLVRRSWPYLRLVTACRAGDVAPGAPLGQCAADLARLRLLRGRRLAPLSPPEADALVSAVAGEVTLPAGSRARITHLSGGLPLFLVELARAAADAQATGSQTTGARPVDARPTDTRFTDTRFTDTSSTDTRPTDTRSTGASSTDASAGAGSPSGPGAGTPGADRPGAVLELPWHLRLAVVHQLAALPDQVVLLLRRMAVAGPTVPLAALVTDERDVELVLDRLDVARRYRILDETRHGFRFRYPIVREILASGLGPNRRRLWRSGGSIAGQRTGGTRSADVRHAPVRTA
jgi:transcriptional regulator with XRE-family HTH domain